MGLFESCVVLYVLAKNVLDLHGMQMLKIWLYKDTCRLHDLFMIFEDQKLLSGEDLSTCI